MLYNCYNILASRTSEQARGLKPLLWCRIRVIEQVSVQFQLGRCAGPYMLYTLSTKLKPFNSQAPNFLSQPTSIATKSSYGQYQNPISAFLLAPAANTAWFWVSIRWCLISDWNICGPRSQSPGNIFPGFEPVLPSHPKPVRDVQIPQTRVDFL